MKNDKENSQEVNIETNNDAVLYSVMLSFLKRKAKEYGKEVIELSLTIDEEGVSIDLYAEGYGNGSDLLEEVKI